MRAGADITSRARGAGATAAGSAASSRCSAAANGCLTSAEAAVACPPPPSAAASRAASTSGTRLRVTHTVRPCISTSTTSAAASVTSISLWARFATPSTYCGQASAATRTSMPAMRCGRSPSSSASNSATSSGSSGVRRKRETSSWRAPCRMHQASASASRSVLPGKVSEPVSSWMPSAKAVASNGVTVMPRPARMPTSVVVSAPSAETTTSSGSAQSGAGSPWWSNTTFSTAASRATGWSRSSRRSACTVSTITSRRIAAGSIRATSTAPISSASRR